MISKNLITALLACGLGAELASAGPLVPPKMPPTAKPSSYQPMQPGSWITPNGYREMTFISGDSMLPTHLRKRADDPARLKLKKSVTLHFRHTEKKHKKRDDKLGDMTQEEFDNYVASITAEPWSDDKTSHPIIEFDGFKELIKDQKFESDYKNFKITMKFNSAADFQQAQKEWDLDPKDHDDFFYLIVDATTAESPDTKRLTPWQVQSVTMQKDQVVVLEAYPMAWDVLGKLDMKFFTERPNANKARDLTKRLGVDFAPSVDIPISINKAKKPIKLFEWPIFQLTPKQKYEKKVVVECAECWTEGMLHLGAHIRTSWWWVEEASFDAAIKFKGVVDVTATVEVTTKINEKKEELISWGKDLANVPVTPLTIFGIINLGPEVTLGIHGDLSVSGKIKVGAKLEADIDSRFKIDLVNLGSFDLSTIKGPQVKLTPHLDRLEAAATATMSLVTGVGISANILGNGLASKAEILLPKFEHKIEGGFREDGFCEDYVKKDKTYEKSEKTKGEKWGVASRRRLGFQVKFSAFTGEGLLKGVLSDITWKPDFLNQMWDITSPSCVTFKDIQTLFTGKAQDGKKGEITEGDRRLMKVQTAEEAVRKQQAEYWGEYKRVRFDDTLPFIEFEYRPTVGPIEVMKWQDAEEPEDVRIIEADGKETVKKSMRKVRKLVKTTVQGPKMEEFYKITNINKGQIVGIGQTELQGPMKGFRKFHACRFTTKDPRTNKNIEFLACLSKDPYIRSKTACPYSPKLKDLLEASKKKLPPTGNYADPALCHSQQKYVEFYASDDEKVEPTIGNGKDKGKGKVNA
ncbi:hypothetical protein H072_6725 [Dactylellina haptotyla CBS 200.50]|uniref:Uncharacterized protein n=1 Tax=Dactylellina haptotyla (strain CBS 200.50) TaxID=1284197 RepID=S8BJP3_DACHA|nr:hypothetical protein H072_6725 [Dactylellina haptotyla CBS 200.50]